MEKRVQRLEGERTFVSRGSGLTLNVATAEVRASRILRLQELDVRPPGSSRGPVLYRIDELVLARGERAVLLGANGAGKSSLIRTLVTHYRRRREETRTIAFSPQVSLGYYDQELGEVAPGSSMVEYLRAHTDAGESALRSALMRAGFAHADHTRAVSVLSGGERARLLFVRLELARPSLLILDEPTNHIDIDGREALESQLLGSGATMLITSHDRHFIESVANRFLVIENGRLSELQDPDEFYRGVEATTPDAPVMASGEAEADDALAPDALLARLVALEDKLAADLARKPRFQKPTLQASWRQEIDALNRRLEDI